MAGSLGAESPDHRFFEYARTRDRRVRNELILAHRDLARALARRYQGRGESPEDLEQVAVVGLVKAVERFDPARGVAFSTFAVPTIAGELKRHFRGQWIVRVPRSLQEQVLELGLAIEELTTRFGRSPNLEELAAFTGQTEEALLEAMEARLAFSAVPIDSPGGNDGGADAVARVLAGSDEGLVAIEAGLLVRSLLEHLGPREQDIMRLRFYDELTQSEIAARVGLSQMQVSRLIRSSIDKLRALAAS
jgi:RNA polymerase sigma-B factor